MEKERFMPACVQMKTFNFNYNNSLMLSVKKKNKRLVGEFTLSSPMTNKNECSNVARIYSFFISLQKQKIFHFIYK